MTLLRALDWPPVWLAGFVGLALLSRALLAASPAPLAGGALVALGLGLALWAALAFQSARTTIIPRRQPSALVAAGPYRFSRNPIYLADLILLAGAALWAGAPLGLLLIPVFALVLTRRFIEPEERLLAARIGAPYAAFRARVRRWL